MVTLYLVRGASGEYSDRTEWSVALYRTEAEARRIAEEAKKFSSTQKVIHDNWNRTVYHPWFRKAFPAGFNLDRYERPDRPVAPVSPTNPYDPERGYGDDYFVEEVTLRD